MPTQFTRFDYEWRTTIITYFHFMSGLRMGGASPSRHLCSLKRWYPGTAKFSHLVNTHFVNNYFLKLSKTSCFQCKIVGKLWASKKTNSARDKVFFHKRQFLHTWQDRRNILISKINRRIKKRRIHMCLSTQCMYMQNSRHWRKCKYRGLLRTLKLSLAIHYLIQQPANQ